MRPTLTAFWERLPEAAQTKMRRTGVPYCVRYVARYREVHDAQNFCGNLPRIKDEYRESTGRRRADLARQFDRVVDSLVMKNGVKKTTYSRRQAGMLAELLKDEQVRCHKDAVTVLDVPSSVGTASLDFYDLLARCHEIRAYVLGDLYFSVLYDGERCIFDEDGDLLQVKLRKSFFSIYRPHCSGDVYNRTADCLLLPLRLASWYWKRRYAYRRDKSYRVIPLIHPDVESRVGAGSVTVRRMDVFKPIQDRFDIIISFNLLQRNYFPLEQIQAGVENLKNALNDGGLLIMGTTESYCVSRRIGGELRVVRREGEF